MTETKKMQEEPLYQVQKIMAEKVMDGYKYYKVKWRGYPAYHATWEPQKNLALTCHAAITIYKESLLQKSLSKKKQPKSKATKPEKSVKSVRSYTSTKSRKSNKSSKAPRGFEDKNKDEDYFLPKSIKNKNQSQKWQKSNNLRKSMVVDREQQKTKIVKKTKRQYSQVRGEKDQMTTSQQVPRKIKANPYALMDLVAPKTPLSLQKTPVVAKKQSDEDYQEEPVQSKPPYQQISKLAISNNVSQSTVVANIKQKLKDLNKMNSPLPKQNKNGIDNNSKGKLLETKSTKTVSKSVKQKNQQQIQQVIQDQKQTKKNMMTYLQRYQKCEQMLLQHKKIRLSNIVSKYQGKQCKKQRLKFLQLTDHHTFKQQISKFNHLNQQTDMQRLQMLIKSPYGWLALVKNKKTGVFIIDVNVIKEQTWMMIVEAYSK